MTVSDFYDSTESSAIASPDWSHLNVETKPTLKLKWNEIYINDDLNASKVKEHSSEEIQSLKLSFSEKVDIKEYPLPLDIGVVIENLGNLFMDLEERKLFGN